jgi:hypothetical protein
VTRCLANLRKTALYPGERVSGSGAFISRSTTGEGLLRQARIRTKLCASPDSKLRKTAELRQPRNSNYLNSVLSLGMDKTLSQKTFDRMLQTVGKIRDHSLLTRDDHLLTLAETLDGQLHRFVNDLAVEGRVPELAAKH